MSLCLDSLRYNSIGPDGAQYLASALYVNDGLRFLCLSCNDLCGVDMIGEGLPDLTGFASLMRALHVNRKLRTLKLAENQIGDEGAKHIADALRENKRLMVLDLHGNNLFGFAELQLRRIGNENSKVRKVDVSIAASGCSSTDTSTSAELNEDIQHDNDDNSVIHPLINEIIENLVETVVFNNSRHDCEDSADIDSRTTHLEHFRSRSSSYSDEVRSDNLGGASLLSSIGQSHILTSIDISWSGLGPNGLSILVSAILNNATSSLTYLDIHGNPVKDDGVCCLSKLIESSSCNVGTLNMQHVGMRSQGVAYLGAALATNTSISKLNISSNNIEAAGSEKLSMGLRANHTVTDLNLRQCGLCSEGTAHIANMLQYNKTLTFLNLSSNGIDDDGATSLAATIAINKSLQTLDLSNYVKEFSLATSISGDTSPPLKSSGGKVKVIRKAKRNALSGRIEESGMEVLALSIRSNQVHLKKLILKGHWLTPKSEEEILSAIDFRRICVVEAHFPTMEERYREILCTMHAEREILTSCYTPNYLRVHVCGQDAPGKVKMLDRWTNGKDSNRESQTSNESFYSGFFSNNQSNEIVPGIGKRNIYLSEKINLVKKAVDPALEIGIWNYEGGHDFHNIFRLHIRGAPLGLCVVCTSMVGKESQCRSTEDVAKELYAWVSLLLTYGHNARDIAVVFMNGERFDKAWSSVNPLVSQKVTTDEKDALSDPPIDKSTSRDDMLNQSSSSVSMSSMHSISLSESSKLNDSTKKGNENDIDLNGKSIEALLDRSSHSDRGNSVEGNSSYEAQSEGSKQSSAVRRKFEESLRENLSVMLGSNHLPQSYVWDEGHNHSALHSRIEGWIRERYRTLSRHVRVPSICKILREQCLPLLRKGGSKVVDITVLLKEGQKHVRCLQNLELRHACQWLHQLGDIVVVDITRGNDTIFHEKSIPGNDDTKQENKFFKIILDPSWFSANVLVPIVGRPSSLSVELHCTQPWGGKEYLLSSSLMEKLFAPIKSKLRMSHADLLLVLQQFRIGAVLTCQNISGRFPEKVLCVPSRISESGKTDWLRGRSVAHIPLSLSSSDLPAVTAVIARRISPRRSFIIPPCFFTCIQAEMMFILEQREQMSPTTLSSTHMDKYKVVCWDKGLGIWRDCSADKSGVSRGSVCALIESTPKWIHNNWAQNPECAVDVIVWGEGNCSVEVVQETLTHVMSIVRQAGDIVLNGSLRSYDENNSEENHLVDSPYAPTLPPINWQKISYLRPGCAMHTLSQTPSDRDCGVCVEDVNSEEPSSAPVLVSCHHPQPRLTRKHLMKGYVLAHSPGGGKGLLRSISESLSELSTTDDSCKSNGNVVHTYKHPFIDFKFDSTVASE